MGVVGETWRRARSDRISKLTSLLCTLNGSWWGMSGILAAVRMISRLGRGVSGGGTCFRLGVLPRRSCAHWHWRAWASGNWRGSRNGLPCTWPSEPINPPCSLPPHAQGAAPFRAVSVCVAHEPRLGACASRSQPTRACPCLFVFLFYGLFCSAFGFCCALTGSLSFGGRARCPLKTTPNGFPHSLALPSRCRCGEGSIRGEGTVSCSRGNCRGTGSDTNRTGSWSKLRC